MSSINFDNVYLLLIAVPLVVLFAVPFAVTVRSDNRNGHNVASLVLHLLMAVLIGFAAAGTNVQTTVTETNVIVVADVSHSANRNLDEVDDYIKNLELPRNSKVGVVCFGKDYQLLTEVGEKFTSVKNADVDGSETNITSALDYAGTLFKDGVIKRIVLITDGKQSDARDVNALQRSVTELKNKDIYVDAIYLDDNIPDDAKEVQVSAVQFTKTAYIGSIEQAVIAVQSNNSANATVNLYLQGEQDELVKTQFVQLEEGDNNVVFDLPTAEAGTFKYRVEVQTSDDSSNLNNSYTFTQTVASDVKVLFLTGDAQDIPAARQIFNDNDNVEYITVSGSNTSVPYTVEDLCYYDTIVLSNVDIRNVRNCTAFTESLRSVVDEYGKSLVTFGNTYIQSDKEDSEELQILDGMLPVRFGNDNNDSKYYTIVLDISRSMQLNYKLIIAKEAANYVIDEFLTDEDYLSIVTFDSDVASYLSPARKLGDTLDGKTYRETAKEDIASFEARQGTVIGAGLREAFNVMQNSRAVEKRVFLISDGLTYSPNPDLDPSVQATELYNNDIQTLVIDVGRYGDPLDQQATGEATLKGVAANGGGESNYYFVGNSLDTLQDVVFPAIKDRENYSVIEENADLKVDKGYDEVLDGVDVNSNQFFVGGYYFANERRAATTVLSVDFRRNGTSYNPPIYAYWQPNKGKVATFTSDIKGDWIRGLIRTGANETLFSNVFGTNVPDERIDYPFAIDFEKQGKYVTFTVTPTSDFTSMSAEISVKAPGEFVAKTEEMTLNAPTTSQKTRFVYELELPCEGYYEVSIAFKYGDEGENVADASFNVAYMDEYDEFASYSAAALNRAVKNNGGQVSEGENLKLENDPEDITIYTVYLTVPLLIAAVVLWLADIVIRKLKWADVKTFFRINRKKKEDKK